MKGKLVMKKNVFDCDIEVKCDQCGIILYSKMAESHKIHGFKKSVATDNNSAIVYNSMLDGTGRAGVNNLCGILGLDAMALRTYERHKTYIQSASKSKYLKYREKVDQCIFNYYKKSGIHPDENGIYNVEVIFDGTWMTRGHSSNIGAGIIAEANTGTIQKSIRKRKSSLGK